MPARGVRLTEPGQVLARHAIAISSAMDAANGELAELVGLRTGTVRLAAFPSASSTLVPRLLRRMRDSHPGITVTYLESEEPEALGLLRDGLVDLAITSAFPGDRADPHRESEGTFDAVPLFTEPVVLALPSSHPLAAHDPVELAALGDASWIAGCPVCRGHLLAACEAVGVVPRIEFETDNAVAVLNLVAAGPRGRAAPPARAGDRRRAGRRRRSARRRRRAIAASGSCRSPDRAACRPSRRSCARSCSSTATTGA